MKKEIVELITRCWFPYDHYVRYDGIRGQCR